MRGNTAKSFFRIGTVNSITAIKENRMRHGENYNTFLKSIFCAYGSGDNCQAVCDSHGVRLTLSMYISIDHFDIRSYAVKTNQFWLKTPVLR